MAKTKKIRVSREWKFGPTGLTNHKAAVWRRAADGIAHPDGSAATDDELIAAGLTRFELKEPDFSRIMPPLTPAHKLYSALPHRILVHGVEAVLLIPAKDGEEGPTVAFNAAYLADITALLGAISEDCLYPWVDPGRPGQAIFYTREPSTSAEVVAAIMPYSISRQDMAATANALSCLEPENVRLG